MKKNMLGYCLLIAALVLFGVLIGYFELSPYWGVIPCIIGGFSGSYMSDLTQILLNPNVDITKRDKVLKSLRVLTFGWSFLSVVFILTGYALVPYLK